MERVPKKNISWVLADIKHPKKSVKEPAARPTVVKSSHVDVVLASVTTKPLAISASRIKTARLKKRRKLPLFPLSLLVFSLVFLAVVMWGQTAAPEFKQRLVAQAVKIWRNFEEAKNALMKLQPEKALLFFQSNKEELAALETEYSFSGLLKKFQEIAPPIKNTFELITKTATINSDLFAVATDLAVLKLDGFNFLLHGDGKELLGLLDDLKNKIAASREGIGSARNTAGQFKNYSPYFGQLDQDLTGQYLNVSADFYEAENFLGALIGLLKQPSAHLLLIFQNPSEMRPAGGFIGSYADLEFGAGRLANMDVRDIYDPDGQLDWKVVPPKPLQAITDRWGARDSNWFFDWPASARKTIQFLETSKIYQERGIKFDGAIALNVNVIAGLLEAVGPIPLADYDKSIDKDNFLIEIQKEVEAGPDKAKNQPKRILRVLTPILLERLSKLDETGKKKIFTELSTRLYKKDIIFYFKDPQLQNFFRDSGFSGDVYDLPENFFGNYLAVVNANIAGGKSDAFIDQEIKLETELNLSGRQVNRLTIKRTHRGNERSEWWWRQRNQNFVKILTPPGAALISASGTAKKIIKPPLNYEKAGYFTDPEVKAVEETMNYLSDWKIYEFQEYRRSGLAGWFNVEAGKSKTLELEYETPLAAAEIKDGRVYQFIFDKQSGASGGIQLRITAPAGFKWQESDKSVYEYFNAEPDARIILSLILIER